jgi:2-polyprenyl-3-methyl-5-hydroxy-6-metoxy-1,4-benzoquinol methylase
MKVLDKETKFAHLGKPGSIFSKGFQRRLDIITKLMDFKDKKILDLGCGEGVWLSQFTKFTAPENVLGSEYDQEQVDMLKKNPPKSFDGTSSIPVENIIQSPGEALKFDANTFDIVFQNEVLEHVQDDVKTIEECLRVLKPGGKLVFFTPNRGWPFEQHGIFLNGKYYWGNIPFLPWMPKFIHKKFAPHVRNYSNGELNIVIQRAVKHSGISAKIVYHKHVFSGFDGLARKFGILGKVVQKFFHFLEKTPLNFFGISHLVIVEKI